MYIGFVVGVVSVCQQHKLSLTVNCEFKGRMCIVEIPRQALAGSEIKIKAKRHLEGI